MESLTRCFSPTDFPNLFTIAMPCTSSLDRSSKSYKDGIQSHFEVITRVFLYKHYFCPSLSISYSEGRVSIIPQDPQASLPIKGMCCTFGKLVNSISMQFYMVCVCMNSALFSLCCGWFSMLSIRQQDQSPC